MSAASVLALHQQLEECFTRDEPEIERDADLAQVLLIDCHPALGPLVGIEQLDNQRPAGLDEAALAISRVPPGVGEQLQAGARIVRILRVVGVLVDSATVVGVLSAIFLEKELFDELVPIQKRPEGLPDSDVVER